MIGRKEIIDNIERNQKKFTFKVIKNNHDKIVFSKVISLYMKYMYLALLDGHKWWMWRFGTFTIESKEMPLQELSRTPSYYKGDKLLRNERIMNPKTIGIKYFLNSKIPIVEKYSCRFASANWFRTELSRRLFKDGKIEPLWQ
jgi:hypothetical protein